MRRMRTRPSIIAIVVAALSSGFALQARVAAQQTRMQRPSSVYVAYYWRAKPDQKAAYDEYIRTIAEPIDEDARRTGAFEEVHTVTPGPGVSADWTHLRIFRVKDLAAAQALGAALDAATKRVVADEAQRKANSDRAAGLRDFVRQEIWAELK
jgi:hypothetical protein